MNIHDFIKNYKNHPVLFIGAGLSLRYLKNAYTWDGLLKHIATELKGSAEFYLDIKSKNQIQGGYDYPKIAMHLESVFNEELENDRNGKFKYINDIFYQQMDANNPLSRFKIFICEKTKNLEVKQNKTSEIAELKKIRKNVGSIITTNYDSFIENIFEFNPLVGNDILLSNPYGAVYKIHGCSSDPSKIIITEKDYSEFSRRHELIRAQLLSIFIHNPIIFIGYNIGDENIKSLLKTIFTYVDPSSPDANKIRGNFLLVEHDPASMSHEISEHDIDLEGFSTIRINKIKTDDFKEIYKSISNLTLPITAMDVRKVQNIVQEILSGVDDDGNSIKVQILDDIDSLKSSDKVLAIGSSSSIKYEHRSASSFIRDYFNIMEESNHHLINVINDIKIDSRQWFPVFGFSSVKDDLVNIKSLKSQQVEKITSYKNTFNEQVKKHHNTIEEILKDNQIPNSYKEKAIFWSICTGTLEIQDIENYLKTETDKTATDYRKLLCAYDYTKYAPGSFASS